MLAAEGFVRALSFAALGEGAVAVSIVEQAPESDVRTGRGPGAHSALQRALGGDDGSGAADEAAADGAPTRSQGRPPGESTTGGRRAGGATSPWVLAVAGAAGTGAVLTAAGASTMSFSLAADLDAAARGERRLENYESRSATFWALSGTALVCGAVAAGVASWALFGGTTALSTPPPEQSAQQSAQ